MIAPALLIVTGHPTTGKTTLASHLAAELSLPLLSKDMLKETLFDTLGSRDREWSHQVGVAAIALLYRLAGVLLGAGRPLIIESNFRPDLDTPRMLDLRARHPFRPVQLRCVASGEVMAERYLRRIAAGQRHPGHCESPDAAEVVRVRGHIEPLALGGAVLTIDTTDLADINMAAITGWAGAHLAGDPPPLAE
ncbi:MAG: ATP-binding protein [Chloroflexales bacterium]|nr:ATP-binding protein [Chloroflexales bacterium]